MGDSYIKWLSELDKNSGGVAGGKGANLAEMFNANLPVPPAFIITTEAYNYLIEKTSIKKEIEKILNNINVDDTIELDEKSTNIREIIVNSQMPKDLEEEIIEAYEHLSTDKKSLEFASKNALSILKHSLEPTFVAVRSSATTEDLEDSSFAGQQETYLNVKGNKELLENVKKVFASLFTSRAIYYRKKRGFSGEKFALAVVVQKMINSDKSGVMFSKNPVKNNNNVLIEAVFGLGEGIVSGKINPDTYEVSSELEIISRKIGIKKIALTRNSNGKNVEVKLTEEKQTSQVLKDSEIKSLANFALKIEEHYKKPQDIEFAIESGEIYIVQSRPITTKIKDSEKKISGNLILEGLGASPGVRIGKVKIINSMSDLDKVEKGDILVTKMTNPDMVVTMAKANAIVTDEGGITSHAAIVSREMGIPAVVGTGNATEVLKDGQIITVDGSNGKIYSGESEEKSVEIKPIVNTKTKIKVIVDIPEAAHRATLTKCNEIGLLRLEGIIASQGKHPMQYEKENKLEEYEDILERGISKISEKFIEIWIRTSDLRSDEFSSLKGSPEKEGNPMLGNHGIRFSLKHPRILSSELNAVKKIALKNEGKIFGIMFPQVISPSEVNEAKKIANLLGLLKLKNIKFGIMVETPAAALIIRSFMNTGISFVSFGTNDLTQYILAIDRNNEEVQNLFNEMHPAVLNAIKRVIRTCKEYGVETSICGQAGSRKEMVSFLVENEIDSISVNADAAYEISKIVAEIEVKNNDKKKVHFKASRFKRSKNYGKKESPEKKTQEVLNKIESEIVKEVLSSPGDIFTQDNNQKRDVKIPYHKSKIEKPLPAYISSTKDFSFMDDMGALKALFGDNNKISKIEFEKKSEIDDKEEKTDIF
ncbi:MAG: phosphoenolpyruvate synthase [Candidatus Pacearchaeota archaeon]